MSDLYQNIPWKTMHFYNEWILIFLTIVQLANSVMFDRISVADGEGVVVSSRLRVSNKKRPVFILRKQ